MVANDRQNMTETRTWRIIKASPEKLYAAFMDPAALLTWLPPAPMTGRLHAFDARPGGGYRLSLFYPPDERRFRGKTGEREDRVDVRFVELVPARRMVEAATFDTVDPALQGEMTITVTFEPMGDATTVTFHCANLPPGLRPDDNEAGTRLSLEQLARYMGSP
jgi:uncharacterized protein YndB with AHSA1/START domain